MYYTLVDFEKVKDYRPYAERLPDGRAILSAADMKMVPGLSGATLATAEEVKQLKEQQREQESIVDASDEPINTDEE